MRNRSDYLPDSEASHFRDPNSRYEIRQYRGCGLIYMGIDGEKSPEFSWNGGVAANGGKRLTQAKLEGEAVQWILDRLNFKMIANEAERISVNPKEG